MRQINQAGLDLIKRWEGLRLKAYPDPATGGAPWTIGYGHTGPEVVPGLIITDLQAEEYLVNDLRHFCEKVSKLVTHPITDNQFAALVSFAYNCGPANLKSSTLLRLINEGDVPRAAEQFKRWNKAAGKVMSGLTKRRAAEAQLFLTPGVPKCPLI